MRRLFAAWLCFFGLALVALAETGTPYPPGTKVEVGTPAGTVSGTLKDRIKDGWIAVLEPGRKVATAIPERSVGFIRPDTFPLPKALKAFAADDSALDSAAAEHFIFGQPRITDPKKFVFKPFANSDEEVEGCTVLRRFAFSLGHYDKFKVPAWVAMRWTKHHHAVAALQPSHARNFIADIELPPYARTDKDYQHSKFAYQRGHMARHEDLSGFGTSDDARRGTKEGCRMSNIVPQQQKGHTVWGKLEEEHHEVVDQPEKGIDSIWLIAGPVFKNGVPRDVIGPAKVGAPDAVYKIIAWKTAGGGFTARAYIIHQDSTGNDLNKYLTTIRAIELATGLDFFSDMDDEAEETLELRTFAKRWEDN